MELRKEWREMVEEFFKKQDSLHHGTYFQATKWQLDDLALRLQALADKEMDKLKAENLELTEGLAIAESQRREAFDRGYRIASQSVHSADHRVTMIISDLYADYLKSLEEKK